MICEEGWFISPIFSVGHKLIQTLSIVDYISLFLVLITDFLDSVILSSSHSGFLLYFTRLHDTERVYL